MRAPTTCLMEARSLSSGQLQRCVCVCGIEHCVCDVATALSFHSLCTQAIRFKKYSTASDVYRALCV